MTLTSIFTTIGIQLIFFWANFLCDRYYPESSGIKLQFPPY